MEFDTRTLPEGEVLPNINLKPTDWPGMNCFEIERVANSSVVPRVDNKVQIKGL